MLHRLSLSITIDTKDLTLFEDFILNNKIPIRSKTSISRNQHLNSKEISNSISRFPSLEQYYIDSDDDAEFFDKKANDLIIKYLDLFIKLAEIKDIILADSRLILVFLGIIKHEDVIDLRSDVIQKLASLGLGVSYDYVWD